MLSDGTTMSNKKNVDPIPEEFASYEEAAEFWDTHDTTDYLDAFRTVEVVTEFRSRHYEVELEAEVVRKLQAQARRRGVTVSRLASDLLRHQLSASG
jgi:predicted phosphatase